ncbi:unnamed protein product [Spirodela intermedia]|uniref:Defective in cullin neddylation protein n=1 Tax=Spirodela intermedia TaxID=51605 RepID=A0A7I8IN08_SPIIN|nr:unnamed protein product [Spirodela intermedia]CAA6659160.1 unnamed protein product [Spirodela intermedia]
MTRLTKKRRGEVSKSMRLTGSNDDVGFRALIEHELHLNAALDHFCIRDQIRHWLAEENSSSSSSDSKAKPHVDMILANGIECLCRELQVDPQDIVMLVLSSHMRAATMCEFSRQEFIDGLEALGVDSLETLREKIPSLRAELKDEQIFSVIYNFAFDWAKEEGQRSMTLDTAIGMWQLLLTEKCWPLVDHWCLFLQARQEKAISRDTWTMVLEFVKAVLPPLSLSLSRRWRTRWRRHYDADGAWPSLIDGFVGYLREGGIFPSS